MGVLSGRMLMPSDLLDTATGPAALVNPATGTLIETIASSSATPASNLIPYGTSGDSLPSGVWGMMAESASSPHPAQSFAIYDSSIALVANVTSIITAPSTGRIFARGDGNTTFYVAYDTGLALADQTIISTVSSTGTVGGTTWTLPVTGGSLISFAVNAAGTIAYFVKFRFSSPYVIQRWDLVNNVALADLASGSGTETPGEDSLFVMPDGSIVIGFSSDTSDPTTWKLRQYDTSGTVLQNLTLGSGGSDFFPELGVKPDDATSFYVKSFNNAGTTCTVQRIKLSDFSVISTWSGGTLNGTGSLPVSCPLLVLAGTASASITVTKNAGSDTTTSFAFTAGGGLSPASFNLTGGNSEIFSSVSAGTYSIAETTLSGWLPAAYSVSNGDSQTAITVAAGDNVTVTVTNTKIPTADTIRYTRRLRRFPLPFEANVYQFLSRLEVLVQSGVGLATGQGSDPVIMCRISRDGGETWGYELTMGLGKQGQYNYRAYLNRLGRGRNFVVELTTSDPVFVAILAAYADLETGTA